MECSYYKSLAKQHLAGKWGAFIGCSALVLLVLCAPGIIVPGVGFLVDFLLSGVNSMAFVALSMTVVRGSAPTMSDAFLGFNSFGRNLWAAILVHSYALLWGLLLIVPGVIKWFSYSATFYILRENPGMGADEAITLSRRIMDGHKMEAFALELSFIGWWFLVGVTLGFAGFYVIPYYSVTLGEFYCKLIDDYRAHHASSVVS